MTVLDEERWYCYKDDLIFFPKENLWSDDKDAPVSHTPLFESSVAVGTRNQGIMRGAGVELLLSGIGNVFLAADAYVAINNVQSLINQYAGYYSQTEIYNTLVPVSLSAGVTQNMGYGIIDVVIALVSVLLLLTRKNPYSRGWWLGFGTLSGIGGAALVLQATYSYSGSLNMSVADILSTLQNSVIEHVAYAVVGLIAGMVLMHLGEKTNKQIGVLSDPIEEMKRHAPECKICKKRMNLVSPDRQIWYCEKDRRAFYALENRSQENVDHEALLNPQTTATKFCRKCGAKIPRDSDFCEECGTRLTQDRL